MDVTNEESSLRISDAAVAKKVDARSAQSYRKILASLPHDQVSGDA